MKSIIRVIKNNYKFILGLIVGLVISVSSVYAVEAYIESKKVSYNNNHTKKDNVQDSLDELYERSGIHKEKWVDKTLNGADPVLQEPLIPVEIEPNGDAYYANLNSEWYNYSEKRWANAVILIDNPSNPNYGIGDKILESDIESYFVWIPKYKYKIWTLANTQEFESAINANTLTNKDYETSPEHILGNARIIDIEFGLTNTENKEGECETPNKSGESGECDVNEWMTHPAFTLGTKELKGFWMGKFETGITATSTGNAKEDGNNIIVKPNITAWNTTTVKPFFDAAKEYEVELDSHMLKNTEWGAVAYLSHSQYGIGNEVKINNNYFRTGYGAAPNTVQSTYFGETGAGKYQYWNKESAYLASTTGNISGVYDMSGGSWEYVAGCIEGTPGDSGFDEQTLTNEMNNGYIDKYTKDSTATNYSKRILGDATGEMGPFYLYYDNEGSHYHNSWYADESQFISSSAPWFHRGGVYNDGILGGQFYFNDRQGRGHFGHSFRMALAPLN